MASLPTDPIRKEHRELLPHIQELDRAAVEVAQWDQKVASARLFRIVFEPEMEYMVEELQSEAIRADEDETGEGKKPIDRPRS